METKEVETSVGTWVVRKPSAGARNKALIKAEVGEDIKFSIYIVTLVPLCIEKRPPDIDQTTPLKQILDEIDPEDFDALSEAISQLSLNKNELEALNKKKTSSKITLKPEIIQKKSQKESELKN